MSKYKPATRAELIALCLRKLGDGMIDINMTDDQCEDAVEEGLRYFRDYHYNGSRHVYLAHKLTPTDISNRYITLPDDMFGVIDVFDYHKRGFYGLSSTDMFSFEYQMLHQQANMLENGSILSYYINRTSYDLVASIMGDQAPFDFNEHQNRVYIHSDWSRYEPDNYIVIEGYQAMDPEVNTDIWNDRWLIAFVTALMKYTWGSNLSKFDSVPIPGGGVLNGSKIRDDADAEIQNLKDEMMTNYSIPARNLVG